MIKVTRSVLLSTLAMSALAYSALGAAAQAVYPTPEASAVALVGAARSGSPTALEQIFGPGSIELLSSGETSLDQRNLQRFIGLSEQGAVVGDGLDGRKILSFGKANWSFPIPLRSVTGGWSFDLEAGKLEMRDRAIGRNELAAIAACSEYVSAQKEYFSKLHDGSVNQYAQRLISTPGRRDGLWWESTGATDRSPLSDVITSAEIEGGARMPARRSHHGYVFRILAAQGRHAPGGAYSYLVKSRMLAGFAMIAYPATWGETGYMTFLCDQRANSYQKNLGPGTQRLAAKIIAFNPNASWKRLGE